MDADFVQLQTDLTLALLSEPLLANINVAQYRALRLQSEIDKEVVCTIPRQGKVGCGILVEMPKFRVKHPNISGPPGTLIVSVLVLEDPNVNMTPDTGTCLSAEWVAKVVLSSSHQWNNAGIGVLSADNDAIQEAEEYLQVPGLLAYRVTWTLQETKTDVKKVADPRISVAESQVSIACATDGAQIYYTCDGSFPGSANAQATLYAAQFEAPAAGAVVRAAGYKDQMFRSSVVQQQF